MAGGIMASQFNVPQSHLLIWNCSVSNQSVLWRDSTNSTRNLSVRNSAFQSMLDSYSNLSQPTVLIDTNHFVSGRVYGAHATTGAAGWLDPLNTWDLHPTPESVLRDRVTTLLAPTDAAGAQCGIPAAIGAFQPVSR